MQESEITTTFCQTRLTREDVFSKVKWLLEKRRLSLQISSSTQRTRVRQWMKRDSLHHEVSSAVSTKRPQRSDTRSVDSKCVIRTLFFRVETSYVLSKLKDKHWLVVMVCMFWLEVGWITRDVFVARVLRFQDIKENIKKTSLAAVFLFFEVSLRSDRFPSMVVSRKGCLFNTDVMACWRDISVS